MKKHIYVLACFALFCNAYAQVPSLSNISGPGTVCSAPSDPQLFSVTAANSPNYYTWSVVPSSGVVISSPSSATTTIDFPDTSPSSYYTVRCIAGNAFGQSPQSTKTVIVYETPVVTFSGATYLCQGSSTNLSASPTIYSASSTLLYDWSPATGLNTTSGPYVHADPATSTTYTVLITLGTCTNTTLVSITIDPTCFAGFKTQIGNDNALLVYPNPNNGLFNIKTSKQEVITIVDEQGQVIRKIFSAPGYETRINDLPAGVYFITTPTARKKVIITKN